MPRSTTGGVEARGDADGDGAGELWTWRADSGAEDNVESPGSLGEAGDRVTRPDVAPDSEVRCVRLDGPAISGSAGDAGGVELGVEAARRSAAAGGGTAGVESRAGSGRHGS